MRVINICKNDWANFSYDNAQAMKSVGVNADSFTLNKHRFNYENRAILIDKNTMINEILNSNIIQLMHSDETSRLLISDPAIRINKKIIVWYTGTEYRQNSESLNLKFNPIVNKSIIALGEFEKLGAKNLEYVVGAIDINKFFPKYSSNTIKTIGHFPSNAKVKGTDNITEVITELKQKYTFNYVSSLNKVDYSQQLKRMENCDIYIEMCAVEQNGKPYGSWGITALEAAAMGKIVVTNSLYTDLYSRVYGECALQISNTKDELYNKLEQLLLLSDADLLNLKIQTRKWVENTHSYHATGTKMKKIFTNL